MQNRIIFSFVAGSGLVAALLLPGCGGGDGGSSAPPVVTNPPPSSQVQVLDTAGVLAIAKTPEDTADPLVVGPTGTTVANTTDETSDPIQVTA